MCQDKLLKYKNNIKIALFLFVTQLHTSSIKMMDYNIPVTFVKKRMKNKTLEKRFKQLDAHYCRAI